MAYEERRIRPLFVFSLPRSGSTLLQRLLASHKFVSTVSEPWIFLPFLYAIRGEGCYAEYAHKAASIAGEDFLYAAGLDRESYAALVGEFVGRLYSLAADGDAVYFLDKTPRYHLIARELLASLPEAKFIFLWRNPAAVPASMIDVSPTHRWNLYEYKIDLYRGVANLVDLYLEYQQDTRVTALCYEQLVGAPEKEMDRLFDFLDLPPSGGERLNKLKLSGRLGDPRGSILEGRVDKLSVDKWKTIMTNPLRLYWLKRYVRWIGTERLAVMGYNMNELESEIAAIRMTVGSLTGDLTGMLKGVLSNTLEVGIFRDKWRQPSKYRVPHR